MSQLKASFTQLINEGIKSIERISDAEKKATACAALASAIAQSGLLMPTVEGQTYEANAKEEDKEALKTSSGKGKGNKKAKETKEVKEVVEEKAPEVEVSVVENDDSDAEWNEANTAAQQENIDVLNQYIEQWGEEYVQVTCLNAFMERADLTSDNFWEFVTPLNLEGFINYLYLIATSDQ